MSRLPALCNWVGGCLPQPRAMAWVRRSFAGDKKEALEDGVCKAVGAPNLQKKKWDRRVRPALFRFETLICKIGEIGDSASDDFHLFLTHSV